MEGITFRSATPEDVPAFVEWVANNPDIPREDALLIGKNPTSTIIVIEKEGKPLLFLPFFALINVAFFGFNPEANARERIAAMEKALEALTAFAKHFNIAAIQGFSKKEYLMAQWALKKGFKEEPRTAFILEIPKDK
jgi:hypothetical protein